MAADRRESESRVDAQPVVVVGLPHRIRGVGPVVQVAGPDQAVGELPGQPAGAELVARGVAGVRRGAPGRGDRARVVVAVRTTARRTKRCMVILPAAAAGRARRGATRCFPRQRVFRTRRSGCSGSHPGSLRGAYGCGSAPDLDRLPPAVGVMTGCVDGASWRLLRQRISAPRSRPHPSVPGGSMRGCQMCRVGRQMCRVAANKRRVRTASPGSARGRGRRRPGRASPSSPRRSGPRRPRPCRRGSCRRRRGWPRSRVDGGAERAVVGDDRETAGGDDLAGVPSPASTPSNTWRASLSLSAPASTSACTSATWAGVTGEVGELHARRRWRAGPARPATTCGPPAGRRPAATVCLDQAERAGADDVAHLQVGEAPVGLQPGAALPRRLGQRGAQLLDPLAGSARPAPGRARGSSGSPRRRTSRGRPW